MHTAVSASLAEQRFNMVVPGGLQIVGAAAIGGAAVHHLGHGLAPGLPTGGAVGQTIVAVYAALFAAKGAKAWLTDRRTPSLDEGSHPHLNRKYQKAYNTHLQAQRAYHARSATAWAALCVTTALQMVVGGLAMAGALPCPAAWAVIGSAVASSVAACAALYFGSQSKFTPHTAITAHLDRDYLHTDGRRAALWGALQAQRRELEQARGALLAGRPAAVHRRIRWEELTKPLCGPTAGAAVAEGLMPPARFQDATAASLSKIRQGTDLTVLLGYMQRHMQIDRGYLGRKHKDLLQQGRARRAELNGSNSAVAAPALQADLIDLLDLHRRRGAAEALGHELEALASAGAEALMTDPQMQRRWAEARLGFILQRGLLGEMLTGDFIAAHSGWFVQDGRGSVWDIDNLRLTPAGAAAFITHWLGEPRELDRAFLRTALNPHWLDGQIEALLGPLEQEAQRQAVAAAKSHTGQAAAARAAPADTTDRARPVPTTAAVTPPSACHVGVGGLRHCCS